MLQPKEPKIRVGYYVMLKTDQTVHAMAQDIGLFPGEVIDQVVEAAAKEWQKDAEKRKEPIKDDGDLAAVAADQDGSHHGASE